MSSHAREVGPGLLALGVGGRRRLHEQHRALAEGERGAARRGGDHRALAALVERAQQPRALARVELLEPLEDDRPALERGDQRRVGHHLALLHVAHVRDDERAAVGLREQRLGVGPAQHHGQVAGAREHRGDRGDVVVAAGVVRRERREPQPGRGRQLVQPRAEQVPGEPVGDLQGALGQRRLGVAEQLDRAEPPQRAVDVEAAHHVGGADALALQQVADQPRARELAGDVVLEVGEQAAEARVELRRRAGGEHRGVEQVQPERGRDGLQPVVGARRGLAARELQRRLVGDVEAAERVGRVGVVGRDALHRGHHAVIDEVEADPRSHLTNTQAIESATESASVSSASPGLETVSGPVLAAPRCCTTWASSWAISRSPSAEPGLYSPLAK